jgi:acyl dehydratase
MDSETTEIGYELPSVVKKVTDESIYNYSMRYSGTYVKMIHVDRVSARRSGFEGLVLQGSQTLDYANEMLFKVYRTGFIENSSINAVFIKPVLSGDVLTIRGKVKNNKIEGSNTYVTVDIWAENKSDEKVMVGEAVISV